MKKTKTFIKGFILFSFLFAEGLLFSASQENPIDRKAKRVLEQLNGGPVVPREANRIVITVNVVQGIDPFIAESIDERLRKGFALDGRLAVVEQLKEAEILLECLVTHYEIQPRNFDEFRRPSRKRLLVKVSVRVIDRARKKYIFLEKDLQAFKLYSSTIYPVLTDDQAQNEVLDMLSERILKKTTTGWYTEMLTDMEKGKGSIEQ